MINILRHLHDRTIHGLKLSLETLIVIAYLALTFGIIAMMACPEVDWCLNKLINLAKMPGHS